MHVELAGAGTECECVQEFRQELGKLKYHSRSVAASASHARSDATRAGLRASNSQLLKQPNGQIQRHKKMFKTTE